MINVHDCSTKTPIDTDLPEYPSRTLFATPAPNEKPSFYTVSLVKLYFAHHIQKLMSMGALKPGFNDYSAIQSIHAEVLHYLSGLPRAMRPEKPDTSWDSQYPDIVKHRLNISIISNSILLALHKPHAVQHRQSSELAIAAAIKVLDDTQLLFERTEAHQYKIYTLCFYTIDAGLLLSAMLGTLPGSEQVKEHAIASLQQGLVTLSMLKEKNRTASAGETALRQCLKRLGHPTEQTQAGHEDIGINMLTPLDTRSGAAGRIDQSTPHTASEKGSRPPLLVDDGVMITPASSRARPESAFDQWKFDGPDLVSQIMDDEAWTASWLEQMNSISSMNFDLDEDSFDWNNGSALDLSA